MKLKKKIIGIVLLLILVSFAIYKYVYKSHRDIKNEKATFNITTNKLIEEFSTNEALATEKYLDKTIAIRGIITALDKNENSITIDTKLFGILKEKNGILKINDSIYLKGRFLGYDELLEEIKMDQISILK